MGPKTRSQPSKNALAMRVYRKRIKENEPEEYRQRNDRHVARARERRAEKRLEAETEVCARNAR